MSRLWRLALISGVGVLFHTQFAGACRYNVRDVGFVDLGVGSHYLFAYVDGDTPKETTGDLEDVLNLVLPDTTLYAEIIDVNDVPGHPAIDLLEKHKVDSYPAVLLVSPEEQSRIVAVDASGEGFKKNFTTALEDLLDSPKRAEILKHLTKAYGVVLLIEGKDADQNAAARQAAEAAVKTIEMHMDYLPKPIEKPPILLTLSRQELAAEEILLWSLGLDAEKIDGPHVVILYGRCRRLGPTLTGDDLTEDIVTNILSIIGADCECGLDRRWMQGAMVPVKWSEDIQSQIVKSLGFDPENPMIKMEMSMILRKGGGMAPGAYGNMNNLTGGAPFGYQEIEVEFEDVPLESEPQTADANEPAPETPRDEPAPPVEDDNPATISTPQIVEPVEVTPAEDALQPATQPDMSLKLLVMMVFGGSVGVLAIGTLILLRARRK